MRVLVVEDEPALREQLAGRLAKDGWAVDAAADGDEGLYLGREHPFDVAVIDLGLPGLSGIELIRELRRCDRHFPVLILTARGRWQDKVEGLESGGDDYLVKPFRFEELIARLKALVRRSAGLSKPVIRYGPIVLDTAAGRVTVDGGAVELTPYEYRVLELLMMRAGEVLSKTELTEHLYNQDFDRDSNVIEVFIRRLRRKLDPDGRSNPIETVRGWGYRFAIPPDAR